MQSNGTNRDFPSIKYFWKTKPRRFKQISKTNRSSVESTASSGYSNFDFRQPKEQTVTLLQFQLENDALDDGCQVRQSTNDLKLTSLFSFAMAKQPSARFRRMKIDISGGYWWINWWTRSRLKPNGTVAFNNQPQIPPRPLTPSLFMKHQSIQEHLFSHFLNQQQVPISRIL